MNTAVNIWKNLPDPFFVLAPMDDVTDTVFRRVVGHAGAPDLYFTEFMNVDGYQSKGRPKVAKKIQKHIDEHSLIAQVWGLNPDNYLKSARDLVEFGFDGIDINMGCPTPTVTKKGACSALADNHELARAIIQATKEGAGDVPVSVKTRIGYKKIQTEEWMTFLLEQDIDALTVHGRTALEMSKVPVHWDQIELARMIRDTINPSTVFVANGDILSVAEGRELAEKYRLDGLMIGRGIFHNPFLFREHEPTSDELIALLKMHLDLYQREWGDDKPYNVLKKYFKIYIKEFDGANELRQELMETNTIDEALVLINE